MKVPQQIIDRAIEAGIVTGAEVSCYITPSDTGIVPPVEKWEHGSGGWFFESGDEAIYVASDESDRFAKILQPAPSQGLEEGMATECSPAMRAAIIELAKELGVCNSNLGEGPLVWYGGRLCYTSGGSNCETITSKLTPLDFLTRLEATAKKPKPIKIGEHNVDFIANGDVKVGCTRVDYATLKEVYERATKNTNQ